VLPGPVKSLVNVRLLSDWNRDYHTFRSIRNPVRAFKSIHEVGVHQHDDIFDGVHNERRISKHYRIVHSEAPSRLWDLHYYSRDFLLRQLATLYAFGCESLK
jgi:hypothetical protein